MTTPMMSQWHTCKQEAKDALLLFRLGDFYEAFYDDAQKISKEMGLTLTARQGIPMCGVPHHTAESYIDKLIAKGYKIAVAEQTEDVSAAKGLIKRAITRVVTPGTLISSQLLKEKRNNYFASVGKVGTVFGLGVIDLTTGEFQTLELEKEAELLDELCRLRPAELIAGKKLQEAHPFFLKELSHVFTFLVNEQEELDVDRGEKALVAQFGKLGPLTGQIAAISAAGALLVHLREKLGLNLDHVTAIVSEPLSRFMGIDRSTMRHLELTESLTEGGCTLLDLVDETLTPMGGRLLARWVKHPLLSCTEIQERHDTVGELIQAPEAMERARRELERVRDLERLAMRVVSRVAHPRDVLALGTSLMHLAPLQGALAAIRAGEVRFFDGSLLAETILSSLSDTPPMRLGDGDVFRDGYHKELDELRNISRHSASWMTNYQMRLREETGIKNLKVGYTRAFGYYIEVSRTNGDRVPESFHRRQTLVNGERYTTEELKKFEHQFLTAEERARALEVELFEKLRSHIATFALEIHAAAKVIARIDALLALAFVAKRCRWARPQVDESDVLEIKEGRHPMVERAIGSSSFIANDTALSPQKQMMLITGPNMAGKSTYIRQVALIVLLAQIGSYVPAASCKMGLVDKIFSRIGASDDLARGQSTFMVEMSETANILNNATSRSLVLLDEIGRGTSTYDGISIAWAVAEFLLTSTGKQAKTLFATHYWELTALEKEFPHAANFQIAVQESASDIIFLRKIIPGGTDKSYGIHVARLAGLPAKAIQRAEERLLELETKCPRPSFQTRGEQLFLFPPAHPLLAELKQLDLDKLTPLAAQRLLYQWKEAFDVV